jgi:hypothetical protein
MKMSFNQAAYEHENQSRETEEFDLENDRKFQRAWEYYWVELLAGTPYDDRGWMISHENEIYNEFLEEYFEL